MELTLIKCLISVRWYCLFNSFFNEWGTWKMLSILHLLHPLIFTMTLYGYDTWLTSFYNGKKKLVSSETRNQTQVLCPSTSCWKIHTVSSHTKQVLLRITPWLLPKPANEQRIFITLKIHYSGFPFIHLIKSFLS